jgi:hypothetical protein
MDFERSSAGGQVAWARGSTPQKGNVFGNLCIQCDNNFGSWYNDAYVGFTEYLAERNLRPGATLPVPSVAYPLRIFKTAIQCFASSLGSLFVDGQPWIRPFLLTKESQALPPTPRLFAFAVARQGVGRGTGPVGIQDERIGRFTVLAEFAFWPLGFILCYRDLDLEKNLPLASISHWASYGYHEKVGIGLALPVNDISMPYPLDYRSPQQVVDESPPGPLPPWFESRT